MQFHRKYLSFVTAAVAAALLPAAPAAHAQVISNTATADWTDNGRAGQTLSNRVDVTVRSRPPEQPVIQTYRLLENGGDKSAPLRPTQCGGSIIAVQNLGAASSGNLIQLSGVYAGLPTTPASLQSSNAFRAGEVLVIGLTLASANIDPNAIDTLAAVLDLANGDRQFVILPNTAHSVGFSLNRHLMHYAVRNFLNAPAPIAA